MAPELFTMFQYERASKKKERKKERKKETPPPKLRLFYGF